MSRPVDFPGPLSATRASHRTGKKKIDYPPEETNFVGGVALVGRRAMVHGLQAKPELNGLACKLIGWHPADPVDPTTSNRFEVDVVGAGIFKLKSTNLKILEQGDLLGETVQIKGLKGRADLNDAHAHVMRWVEASGRFEVMVGGEKVLVKEANIVLPGAVSIKRGR